MATTPSPAGLSVGKALRDGWQGFRPIGSYLATALMSEASTHAEHAKGVGQGMNMRSTHESQMTPSNLLIAWCNNLKNIEKTP